jgi:prepilin signal peptidase PulO-like enzyme (type II secretory pathway)
MMRVIIENIALFLLPTVIYTIYAWWTRRGGQRPILEEAPLALLVGLGTVLVLVVMIAFGSTSGGKPGQEYIPPSLKNGDIEQGKLK